MWSMFDLRARSREYLTTRSAVGVIVIRMAHTQLSLGRVLSRLLALALSHNSLYCIYYLCGLMGSTVAI